MRNALKVGFALAIVALALVLVVPKTTGVSSQSNAGTSTISGQSLNYTKLPSGAIVYDGPGCQDLSAQVTGYDSITGAPCPYTGP